MERQRPFPAHSPAATTARSLWQHGTLTLGSGMNLSAGTLDLNGGTLALNGQQHVRVALGDGEFDHRFWNDGHSILDILGSVSVNPGVTLTITDWTDTADYFYSNNIQAPPTLGGSSSPATALPQPLAIVRQRDHPGARARYIWRRAHVYRPFLGLVAAVAFPQQSPVRHRRSRNVTPFRVRNPPQRRGVPRRFPSRFWPLISQINTDCPELMQSDSHHETHKTHEKKGDGEGIIDLSTLFSVESFHPRLGLEILISCSSCFSWSSPFRGSPISSSLPSALPAVNGRVRTLTAIFQFQRFSFAGKRRFVIARTCR